VIFDLFVQTEHSLDAGFAQHLVKPMDSGHLDSVNAGYHGKGVRADG
jgi:hypothetical protein